MKKIAAFVAFILALPFLFGLGIALSFTGSTLAACGSSETSTSLVSVEGDEPSARDGPIVEQIFRAVQHEAKGNLHIMFTMMMAGYLESRWSIPQPGGPAYGVWQIEQPGVVHPDITEAQAEDISYAAHFMYPEFAAAQRNVSPLIWATDPVLAAEEMILLAERPAEKYRVSQGQAVVDEAFNAAKQVLEDHGISTVTLGEGPSNTELVEHESSVVTDLSTNPCRNGSIDGAELLANSGATGLRQKVLEAANAQIGLPYSWGGGDASGPTSGICEPGPASNDCNIVGFDCSGLTEYAFAQVGIDLPTTVALQWHATKDRTVVPRGGDLARAQPGDLVFFSGYKSFEDPGHVGIYMGDGKMINAPQSGENVKIVSITTANWRDTFVGVTSPFPANTVSDESLSSVQPGPNGWAKPTYGRCTSGFGERWGTQHRGWDIAGPVGTPIYAAGDGTVIESGPASGFGYWIVIDHGDGLVTVYGHMGPNDLLVSVGDPVHSGQQISRINNYGQSTGPHLHFEVGLDGIGGGRVNSKTFMELVGVNIC